MSQSYPTLTITRKLASDTPQARIVAATANDGEVDLATAPADLLMGVTRRAIAAGENGDVEFGGVVPLEYGAAVVPGERLTTDAVGRGVPATVGQQTIGNAWEGGALGTIGSVLLNPGEEP